MGKSTRPRKRGALGSAPLDRLVRSPIDDAMGTNRPVALAILDAPAMGRRRPANWRLLAGCVLAGLGLACATGPAPPGILNKAGIMRHLERLELRDEVPALRLTKAGRRHAIYLTGRELEDGAVVVLEVRF